MPVLGRTAARDPVSDTPALLLCRCYPASAPDLQRAVLGTTTLRRPKGYTHADRRQSGIAILLSCSPQADEAKNDLNYSIEMVVKSCDPLCAGRKPLTWGDIARGFKSCTIHTHGASSTTKACASARILSRTAGSKVSCACCSRSSRCGVDQCPQF